MTSPATAWAMPARGPTALLLRVAAVVLGVVLLGAVHLRRPPTLCVLRDVTGVPCPFCGGTTAAVNLGRGDVGAALRASPLGVLTVCALPFLGAIRARLRRVRTGPKLVALALLLTGAETWQLARFDLIPL